MRTKMRAGVMPLSDHERKRIAQRLRRRADEMERFVEKMEKKHFS